MTINKANSVLSQNLVMGKHESSQCSIGEKQKTKTKTKTKTKQKTKQKTKKNKKRKEKDSNLLFVLQGQHNRTFALLSIVLQNLEGRKHGALRPQKPLRLIRDGQVGGSTIFISNTYSLHCHHQNDSALRGVAL